MLDGLANDIIDARVHLRLYRDLRDAIPEFRREFNQSPAFWTLTFVAQVDAVFARVIRAYDQHHNALSLQVFLDHVAEYAPHAQPPIDPAALAADRASISVQDLLVAKLVALRGNVLAHRNAANIVEARNLEARFALTIEELQTLVDRGADILNHYASRLAGTSWGAEMVGRDDYTHVLMALRETYDQRERAIEQEIAASSRPTAT